MQHTGIPATIYGTGIIGPRMYAQADDERCTYTGDELVMLDPDDLLTRHKTGYIHRQYSVREFHRPNRYQLFSHLAPWSRTDLIPSGPDVPTIRLIRFYL